MWPSTIIEVAHKDIAVDPWSTRLDDDNQFQLLTTVATGVQLSYMESVAHLVRRTSNLIEPFLGKDWARRKFNNFE